jgi:hypothetical protein
MVEKDYQADLTLLLEELLKRCPRNAACSKLLNCFHGDDYDRIEYCCKAWQRASQGSFDWWEQGMTHIQLGFQYARDGRGRSKEAVEALTEAERIFEICDDVCAALTLMARGKVYEHRGGETNREDQLGWKEVERAYGQGMAKLTRVGHPLADKAHEWWSEAVERTRQEVSPSRSEESQQAAPGPAQAAREEGEPQGGEVETGQPPAQQAGPLPQPETKPGVLPDGPAYFFPPANLRFIPVSTGKVRAGQPTGLSIEMDESIEATTFFVGGTEFCVRDTPGRKHGDSLDGFDFGLLVRGDSMEPVIHDGDCLLVSKIARNGRARNSPAKDDIVVIRLSGDDEDTFTVKRYQRRTHRTAGREDIQCVLLKPENESYPSIILVGAEEQTQELEDSLRVEYGDETMIIAVDERSAIEGLVTVILSPASKKSPAE